MKKYYAIQCDPETYDYRCYYDEDMAEYDNIWAGGNSRNFRETNEDLRKDVVRALEDSYYDLFEVDDATEEDKINTIKYYFKKVNKEALTDYEIDLLTNLSKMFYECARSDENDIICQVLTVLHGEAFEHGVIKGSCQGDWLEVIYPESKKDLIPWIEAVWFATGTEFRITEEPVEEDELDDAIQFCAYTDLWRDADIKAWLCKEIGCSPEELVVRKISGQHTYVKYDYEEI